MQASDLAMLPLIIKISEIVGEVTEEEISTITAEILEGYPIDNIANALLGKRAFQSLVKNNVKSVH